MEHSKAWPLPRINCVLTRDVLKIVDGSSDKLATILEGGLCQVMA